MTKQRRSSFIDMTGETYGDFIILQVTEDTPTGGSSNVIYWDCQCKCGNIKSLRGSLIRNGKVRKDCGCTKKASSSKKVLTQEEKQLRRIKNIHRSMMYRCHEQKSVDYPNYGAKGITVIEEWHDRNVFVSDMFESYLLYEEEHGLNTATIDRIDNTKGYSKDNCRWLTREAQIQNRGFNLTATIDGKYYNSIGELSKDYPDIKYHTIVFRHNRGWTDDELVLPLGTIIKQHRAKQKQ